VLRQGTPFYAAYEIKPLVPLHALLARFEGEPRRFLERVFAAAKQGRIWYSLDPGALTGTGGRSPTGWPRPPR
jgi:ATP-dependent DNA helicase RecQ